MPKKKSTSDSFRLIASHLFGFGINTFKCHLSILCIYGICQKAMLKAICHIQNHVNKTECEVFDSNRHM